MPFFATRRRTVPTLLDRLLGGEPTLRRARRLVGGLVAAMVGTIAVVDGRLWPGISLAFGYSVPIALGAYTFGTRFGVELSIVCVILRRVCAGHAYGPWWLYAGSLLMLAEYLMLAAGAGVLGGAVRRLERHARILRRMSELARGLTGLDRDGALRRAVEASVRLTGADGGFVATAADGDWRATHVFADGRWQAQSVVWWPRALGPWQPGRWRSGESPWSEVALQQLGARVQMAAPVTAGGRRPDTALVVFRAGTRPFERPTREILALFAAHLGASVSAANLFTAAREASREKTRALARVAHDLAAPVHVIIGTTDALAPHADPALLDRLRRQTQLLMQMTNDLIEFSRQDVREAWVRSEAVHVPELYERVHELATPLIGDKDLRLEVDVEPGAEWVRSDPEKLRQIVTNLATNAVKYTVRGRVELRAARDNGCVRLAVRDTGIGIPMDERARIFDPFYRIGNGASREAGVGLGLAVAQDLARLLGTSIVVDSAEHAGSTFSLELPAIVEGHRDA